MRIWRVCAAVLAIALMSPLAGLAQEETSKPFVYGIYYTCDVTRQELADEIVDLVYAPAYNAAVEAGQIASWGWMAHHTGSEWRRLIYHSAPDLGSLLAALENINAPIDEEHPEMARALGDICNSHVDYIWRYVVGSRKGNLAEERGKAGFSTYIECDMSREDRADELVEEVFAPVFDRYVAEGKIDSWGWMEHVVGGKWRRIETMSADDHTSLLEARGAIITELYEKHEAAAKEFADICGSHQDFLWNIVHESP